MVVPTAGFCRAVTVGLVLVVAFFPAFGRAKDDVTELKINVIKKPAKCDLKSQGGDRLTVHNVGKLKDGTVFESSRKRNQPYRFVLGTPQAIKGWNKGLLEMCEGETRLLVIPSHMAYGPRGVAPLIPGNATLYWEVELLKIERESLMTEKEVKKVQAEL